MSTLKRICRQKAIKCISFTILAGFILLCPQRAGAASKKKYYSDLMKAVTGMIKENPVKQVNGLQSTGKYASKRLIARTKNSKVDFKKYGAKTVIAGPSNIYFLQFKSVSAAKKAEKEIRKLKNVIFVEPDRIIGVSSASKSASKDKYVPVSRAVDMTGLADFSYYVASVSSKKIKAAVIDTGVSDHPMLKGRIAGGADISENGSTKDTFGHGTHVAGIIADSTPARNVSIVPVRVCEDGESVFEAQLSLGIFYAFDVCNAKVLNISISSNEKMYAVETAINAAVKHDCIVVVSAGNDGLNIEKEKCCPAYMTNVITVGATDIAGNRASFSNFGKSLDVVAPGKGIKSAGLGRSYQILDGTSQAAPYVTALAAELRLLYPKKTAAQIKSIITGCAKDQGKKGWDKYYGYGFIQAPTMYTELAFDKPAVTLAAGDKKTLEYSVKNRYLPERKPVWKSSDKSVAAVSSEGVVRGIKAGKVTITVSAYGKTASCTVKVTGSSPKQKALSRYEEALEKGTALYGEKKYMAYFALIDLDGNEVPELVTADAAVNRNSFTLCGVNGRIPDLYDLFDISTDNRSVRAWYYPKTGIIFSSFQDNVDDSSDDVKYILNFQYAYLPKDAGRVLAWPEFPYTKNELHYADGSVTANCLKYSGVNERISKDIFETVLKKYIGNTAPAEIRLYKNTAANRNRYLWNY